MPNTAVELADKIGRIMNYGDGLYGGIFVAALYSEAFIETNIINIIEKALLSIPQESDYYKNVRDVITLYRHYPSDWRSAWSELENKWGNVDICGAGTSFNIDAKLNGAYIVMGLLYGEGDPMKTLEIATRCGQDSDCNPSNAMAVLGVIKGFKGLSKEMQDGVMAVGDTVFDNTTYTFNSAVIRTKKYALDLIRRNGGKVTDQKIRIKIQSPVAPNLELSFPNLVFDNEISVFEENKWNFKGNWKSFEVMDWHRKKNVKQSLFAENAGDEIELKFTGTGISVEGNWVKDGGKADVFVDSIFIRTIDTYYNYANQEHTTSIWHILNLKPGEHTLRIVVKGDKRLESQGCRVYITKAIIFKSESKKNDLYKFSFEKQ